MAEFCSCQHAEGEGDCEACRATSMALLRDHWVEATAAFCGLVGAWLLWP